MTRTVELPQPRIAILVPTKQRPDALRETLAAALRCQAAIIVCDQSPQPSAVPPGVRLLHAPGLSGLPAARNRLLAAASAADVVVFIDDDTTLDPYFVSNLARLVVTEPDLAGWGPVLESRSPRQQRWYRMAQWGCLKDPRRLLAGPSDRPTRALFGACFAVRRAAAQAIGGFDERRTGYALGEDLDHCLRLGQAGYRLRFSRSLSAVHRCDSAGRANADLRGRDKAQFLRWLARRHGGGDPATLLHLGLALAGAASGRGHEPASRAGVWRGLMAPH